MAESERIEGVKQNLNYRSAVGAELTFTISDNFEFNWI
jgi:hypothetical protein